MSEQQETIIHLADLHPQPEGKNARKHNPRNIGMIAASLQEVGAARSIVIDENGMILAGNGTWEAAALAGIERVRVIDVTGDELTALRRKDLTDKKKVRLALADNRTSDTSTWDAAVLAEMLDQDARVLEGLFREDEIACILDQEIEIDDVRAEWQGMPEFDGDPRACQAIKVYFQTPEDVQNFATLLDKKLTEKSKTLWWPEAPEA